MKCLILFIALIAIEVKAETKYVHKDINKFLHALNMVEASGKSGNIIGDNGRAIGPFQIWKPYYQDAVKASGGALNKSYCDVINIKYAKEVVLWYFYKYAKKDLEDGNWEKLARIHNGGPNGHNNPNTKKYWLKVKKYLR